MLTILHIIYGLLCHANTNQRSIQMLKLHKNFSTFHNKMLEKLRAVVFYCRKPQFSEEGKRWKLFQYGKLQNFILLHGFFAMKFAGWENGIMAVRSHDTNHYRFIFLSTPFFFFHLYASFKKK